jgi:hypothetical protein
MNNCFSTDETLNKGSLFAAVFLCFSFFMCCSCQPDRHQVQIAVHAADFKPFSGFPRRIVYGPYCMNVTETSAVVAWEEKSWTKEPRHVAVELKELSPATEYIYRVNGASQDGRLVTAPADNGTFSFLVVGDTQTGVEVSSQVAAQMRATDPSASFFLHLGDLTGSGSSSQAWQDEWWGPMAGLLLHLPVYPLMGNHDEDSAYYERYFKSLRDAGRNYSFDWGRVHFVVLDFNDGIDAADENIAWLKSDLQSHQDADYIVVCHHLPVYFSDTGDVSLPTKMQAILAPIYEQYGVKLVLSGHLHGYQHHLKNNIHYVISAGGGGKPYDVALPLEGATLRLRKSYNFMDCRVDNEAMHIMVYDADGASLEAFEISKTGVADTISAQIAVEASDSEVAPGGQITLALYLHNISNLGRISFSMPVYKDAPAVHLSVQDAEPLAAGVQVEPGNLGGTVALNSFDNETGVISYREELFAGVSGNNFTLASATLNIPAGAQNTALYFVPDFELYDRDGKAIAYFMGGAKVVIKQE